MGPAALLLLLGDGLCDQTTGTLSILAPRDSGGFVVSGPVADMLVYPLLGALLGGVSANGDREDNGEDDMIDISPSDLGVNESRVACCCGSDSFR